MKGTCIRCGRSSCKHQETQPESAYYDMPAKKKKIDCQANNTTHLCLLYVTHHNSSSLSVEPSCMSGTVIRTHPEQESIKIYAFVSVTSLIFCLMFWSVSSAWHFLFRLSWAILLFIRMQSKATSMQPSGSYPSTNHHCHIISTFRAQDCRWLCYFPSSAAGFQHTVQCRAETSLRKPVLGSDSIHHHLSPSLASWWLFQTVASQCSAP